PPRAAAGPAARRAPPGPPRRRRSRRAAFSRRRPPDLPAVHSSPPRSARGTIAPQGVRRHGAVLLAPDPRSPAEQPEERLAGAAARPAHGRHRRLGVREVLPRLP